MNLRNTVWNYLIERCAFILKYTNSCDDSGCTLNKRQEKAWQRHDKLKSNYSNKWWAK